MTLTDPMGSIIAELRTANVASGRVRGGNPAPGDARGAGEYQRFVVIRELAGGRLPRAPIQFPRYALQAYGATHQDARALYGECSEVLSNAGCRVSATNVPIYNSLDENGSSTSEDPRTGQPVSESVFEVIAGTQTI